MAQYKSGYKRKGNDDRFFTYLIVSIAAFFVLVLGGIGIYTIVNPALNYDDFKDVTIERYAEITQMPEDQYIVYYYGVECGHCIEIKQDVLNFANQNEANIKVYLLESSSDDFANNNITHPVTGRQMSGTPSMVTVVNGVVVDLNVGRDVVVDLIDKINEGSYSLID